MNRRALLGVGGVLVLAAILFFTALGRRGFWEPDEPTFPAVAQEMRAANEWVLPLLNGGLYSEKPILNYWLMLASARVFGRLDEWTARLPAALLGVLGVCLTWILGRRLFGERAGILGALVIALTPLWFQMSRFAYTDGPFAVFVLASLVLFHRGWSDEHRRGVSYALAWLALGLAVLTKGPLALVLVGLTVVTFLAIVRDVRHLLRFDFLVGVLLFAAIVVPWYVIACHRGGPQFTEDLLVRQNFGRFSGETDSHRQPPWFYLGTLPVDLFPWSLFLPGAVWQLAREWRSGGRRREAAFLVAATVPAFLFLSITSSKQGKYLLPIYPMIAIAIGAHLDSVAARWRAGATLLAGGTLALAGIAGALFAAGVGRVPYDEFRPIAAIAAVIALAGGIAILALVRARRHLGATLALAAAVGGIFFVLDVAVFPTLDPYKSPKPLCDRIVARLGGAPEFAIYGNYREGFSYYTRRHIVELKQESALASYLDRPERAFVVMRDEAWSKLPPTLTRRLQLLAEGDVGSKSYVFLGRLDTP
ncbi:MAG: glycosyltransferase family 39 protein [Planctomycetes bacterium]|nr:glycosyltransferase family 39 protein [Planctomycetota bacterium]MBI3844972.1 glycosyltransferase family 39 protein [Planctomycetota bacterium]